MPREELTVRGCQGIIGIFAPCRVKKVSMRNVELEIRFQNLNLNWVTWRETSKLNSYYFWHRWITNLQIATKRSKVLPATLLVGLSVNAVALALATAAAAVEVYCVCARPTAKKAERRMSERIFHLLEYNKYESTVNKKIKSNQTLLPCHHIIFMLKHHPSIYKLYQRLLELSTPIQYMWPAFGMSLDDDTKPKTATGGFLQMVSFWLFRN